MKGKFKWLVLLCCVLVALTTINTFDLTAQMKAAEQVDIYKLKKPGNEVTISEANDSDLPSGFALVTENEHLQLYFNQTTTEVIVKELKNGKIWSTNPLDRGEDTIATTVNKSALSSQLVVSYYDPKGNIASMNNFDESINKKQFEFEIQEDRVKVIYEMGSSQLGISAIPKVVSKERFEERILGQIEDEVVAKRLRTRFFYNEREEVYERKDMPEYVVRDVIDILDSINYTIEDAQADDLSLSEVDGEENKVPRFLIPIEYSLDGEDFIVQVATNEIEDTLDFSIYSIQVLGLFGAANDQAEGYIFVPDGSGALINLNNGKRTTRAYSVEVYGVDLTPTQKEKSQFVEITRFPVFGMKQGEHAMFAIIEQGDAQAKIRADIQGRLNNYNSVNAEFTLRDMEPYEYRSGSVSRSMPKYSELYPDGIAIRYAFLSGAASDYVGMAQYYQNYLVEKYNLQRLTSEENIPFDLELIGAIPIRKTFLGIPYRSATTLTDYNQAIEILQALREQGVANIQFTYSGWFNKSVNHTVASQIKPISKLGNKKEINALVDYINSHDVEMYPDVAFQRVYRNGSGFQAYSDATRFLTRRSSRNYESDLVTTNYKNMLYYLMSPRKLTSVVDDFLTNYAQYEYTNISLRDLGNDLNSDVTPSETYTRQRSIGIITENLAKLQNSLDKVKMSGGNEYAIAYAQSIVDAPLNSSGFDIVDEEIPFYSMVLHGYVPHAGKAINHSKDQDYKMHLLKILETGTNPHYQWFYGEPSTIRDTKFNELYSAYYLDWLDEATQLYKETNDILRDVQDQRIVGHRKLADKVYETTFENGKKVTVNYNKYAVNIEGLSLEAQGYSVGGEM